MTEKCSHFLIVHWWHELDHIYVFRNGASRIIKPGRSLKGISSNVLIFSVRTWGPGEAGECSKLLGSGDGSEFQVQTGKLLTVWPGDSRLASVSSVSSLV